MGAKKVALEGRCTVERRGARRVLWGLLCSKQSPSGALGTGEREREMNGERN